MSPLDTELKRALTIDGKAYGLTITPQGFKAHPQGQAVGTGLAWKDMVNGGAALAVALNASIGKHTGKKKGAQNGNDAEEEDARLARGDDIRLLRRATKH